MKLRINWGWPVYAFSFIVFTFNIMFFYYSFNSFHPVILLFFSPVLVLDILLLPVYKSFFMNLFNKNYHAVSVLEKGIEINRKMHLWHDIKSISFQTGRTVHDYSFMRGFKLPALQRIYILDKKGKEYSAIIDIDYSFKEKRNRNNLIIAKEELYDLKKIALLSDWAEKR